MSAKGAIDPRPGRCTCRQGGFPVSPGLRLDEDMLLGRGQHPWRSRASEIGTCGPSGELSTANARAHPHAKQPGSGPGAIISRVQPSWPDRMSGPLQALSRGLTDMLLLTGFLAIGCAWCLTIVPK